ncbi:hypothetical protein Plec18170_001790 [Paecilomyces lecythidis]
MSHACSQVLMWVPHANASYANFTGGEHATPRIAISRKSPIMEVGNDQDSVATEDVQKVQPERDFVVQDLVSCIAIGKSFEKPEWLKVEDLDMELVAENPDVCCSGDQVGTTWG